MATLLLGLILAVCFGLRVTNGQALGFVLNGINYPNGSTVLRTTIGEGTSALQCTTDSTTCCRNYVGGEIRAGNFYFPDSSLVPIPAIAPSNSYYRSRSSMLISLHRQPTAMVTGQFRCEIPDACGILVNLFINIEDELPIILLTPTTPPAPTCTSPPATTTEPITTTELAVSISISITLSGTNTAGEAYNLECSATVTGSTYQPTITWLDPMNNPVPSEMVTTTGSMSTLTFNPQAAFHAGTYTCRVTAGGVTQTQTSTVIVNVINSQVTRSSSGPLTAGQTGFSLSCDVTGTENLNSPTFTYQWQKNGGVISGQQGSTLFLSPLTASNAGEYKGSVTVNSTSLSSTVTVNSSNTEIVSIQLPAPIYVTVTNGSANVGSDVILTCTVELSPAVDVPVAVITVWTGPAGFMTTNTAQSVMGSTTTYASTTIVRPFGRDQSGDYTCTATIRPMTTSTYLSGGGVLSNTATIRATAPPPLNVQATQASTSAPVEVGWSHPSGGAVTITGYRVFYGNGKNLSVSSDVNGIILALNEDSLGQTVSVRSEADELASQLIIVTITTPPDVVTKSSCSCAVEVGVLIGLMLLLVCLVAIVITVVFIYMRRKRRAGINEMDQSTTMPTPLYENPDKLTRSGQGNCELTECPAYESTATKPQPLPQEVDQSRHYEL